MLDDHPHVPFPGPGDPVPVDNELVSIPVDGADLDDQIGYCDSVDDGSEYGDGVQYLAIWIEPGGNVMSDDGFIAGSCRKYRFFEWDRDRGSQLLAALADVYEWDFDGSEQAHISLTELLAHADYHVGCQEQAGNAALVVDRDTGDIYVGGRKHARQFVQEFNDLPDVAPGENGTLDDDKLAEALREFAEAFDTTQSGEKTDE